MKLIRKRTYLKLRQAILSLILSLVFLTSAMPFNTKWKPNFELLDKDFYFSEEEVKLKIEGMYCLVKTEMNDDVLDQVKRYIALDRGSSRRILERAELYFPLIKKLLNDNNLPEELSYIAAVESALNPAAKSYAGAAGLWQLMPGTAKLKGLTINDKLDQRLDAVQSTVAIIKYFKELYAMFGDWALVFAAYNCGENKIQEIIENTGQKSFWEIRKYLPRQTQLFVPAFIGVSYLMQYYGDHGLIKEFPTQPVTFARIYEPLNIAKMLKSTKIDKELFENYNPSFKKAVVPENTIGHFITLPDSQMVEFVDYYLNEILSKSKNEDTNKGQINEAKEDEQNNATDKIEIISFNRPFIFSPTDIKEMDAREFSFDYVNNHTIEKPRMNITKPLRELVYHIVQSGESIAEIAENYTGVSIDNIIDWNKLNEQTVVKPGTVLIVKK